MKKFIALLALALLLTLPALAEGVPVTLECDGNVNIRAEADAAGEVIGKAASGDVLALISYDTDWSLIEKDGVTGYIASEYLALDPADDVVFLSPKAVEVLSEPVDITQDGCYAADIDGDDVTEMITVYTCQADDFHPLTCVLVDDVDSSSRFVTLVTTRTRVTLADLSGSGKPLILISGGIGNGQYAAYALCYSAGILNSVPFTLESGSAVSAPGDITEISGDTITLSRRYDLFGTRFASRAFALSGGSFTPIRGTAWQFGEVTDSFDLVALTLLRDLYTAQNGSVVQLPAGTRLVLTSVDENMLCSFVTESGATGSFTAVASEEGSGWTVNGIPEDELFSGMQYDK